MAKHSIEKLLEGDANSFQIHMEVDGKEVKGCGCCICAPNTRGAGDATAKISAGHKMAEDVMMVVIGATMKS
ncbi:MAG: hypothetical protein HY852_22520 [Bradyrhizobium sp.]|uniref:hypothetical protein n=1 Tax=Bradyrhizobium sp. TaxID=376 RepID=UPI0025C1BC9F|nr:hypothetical protein [Bradyrhizobium sp.]MBI5264579.1 hypothetical protein [Bradyrhizobium sp.]